jgi:hypothetical protein
MAVVNAMTGVLAMTFSSVGHTVGGSWDQVVELCRPGLSPRRQVP